MYIIMFLINATNDSNVYCILLHPRLYIKNINYDFPRVRSLFEKMHPRNYVSGNKT